MFAINCLETIGNVIVEIDGTPVHLQLNRSEILLVQVVHFCVPFRLLAELNVAFDFLGTAKRVIANHQSIVVISLRHIKLFLWSMEVSQGSFFELENLVVLFGVVKTIDCFMVIGCEVNTIVRKIVSS